MYLFYLFSLLIQLGQVIMSLQSSMSGMPGASGNSGNGPDTPMNPGNARGKSPQPLVNQPGSGKGLLGDIPAPMMPTDPAAMRFMQTLEAVAAQVRTKLKISLY